MTATPDIERIRTLVAVRRSGRPARRAAFALALPLIAFLVAAFVAPILYLLVTAVDNPETKSVLPKTLSALQTWDGTSTPDEAVFAALASDLKLAQENSTAALVGKRLNYEISGIRSKVLAASRMVAKMEAGPYRAAFLDQSDLWAAPETWAVIQRNAASLTPYYLLTAVDLKQAPTAESLRTKSSNIDFTNLLDLKLRTPKDRIVVPPVRIRTEATQQPSTSTLKLTHHASNRKSRCSSASSHNSTKLRIRYN